MKKISYLTTALALLLLAHCKTSQKSASVHNETAFTPSQKQLDVVEKRWPNSSVEDLKEGQKIFVTKCTECHMAYEITGFSEKKWLREIDHMAPKAKLTQEEKLKLTKHILSYREANSVAKAD
jgi:hypothetical protein